MAIQRPKSRAENCLNIIDNFVIRLSIGIYNFLSNSFIKRVLCITYFCLLWFSNNLLLILLSCNCSCWVVFVLVFTLLLADLGDWSLLVYICTVCIQLVNINQYFIIGVSLDGFGIQLLQLGFKLIQTQSSLARKLIKQYLDRV